MDHDCRLRISHCGKRGLHQSAVLYLSFLCRKDHGASFS